jgi:hypothetical protein
MSIDEGDRPRRSLREYVHELIARLGHADRGAVTRLHSVVGERRARIVVDSEAVQARFLGGELRVTDAGLDDDDGVGVTDRDTVLDLMDGYVEVSEAITTGRLQMIGSVENVERMSIAIEILLDGATRTPSLQELARDYRADHQQQDRSQAALSPRRPAPDEARNEAAFATRELLRKLDLLP